MPLEGGRPREEPKMPLGLHDSEFVRNLVHRESSVVLDETKDYLLDTRISRLSMELERESPEELIAAVRKGDRELSLQLVEAMTTPETSFFRDHHPFAALREAVLPKIIESRRGRRKLTIWSAACAYGQEPYSIAMLVREHFPELDGWEVRIIATDLAEKTLARARSGSYQQMEVNRGLPAAMLPKYFTRKGTAWEINHSIREMVEFRQLNLTKNWLLGHRPDIVFLRNVLIYFDVESKRKVLASVRSAMSSDGVLFLGGAETMLNVDPDLKQVAHGRARYYVSEKSNLIRPSSPSIHSSTV